MVPHPLVAIHIEERSFLEKIEVDQRDGIIE